MYSLNIYLLPILPLLMHIQHNIIYRFVVTYISMQSSYSQFHSKLKTSLESGESLSAGQLQSILVAMSQQIQCLGVGVGGFQELQASVEGKMMQIGVTYFLYFLSTTSCLSMKIHAYQTQKFIKWQKKSYKSDQRRKMWDQIMTQILSQKQKMREELKKKIQKVGKMEVNCIQIEARLKDGLQELETERATLALIVNEKLNKIKNDVREDMDLQYKRICHQFQQQYETQLKNNFKFTVTCLALPEQPNSQPKQEPFSSPVQKNCKNVQVLVENMRALENMRDKVVDIQPTIERCLDKIVMLGKRVEILESKVADVLGGTNANNSSLFQHLKQQQPKSTPFHQQLSPPSSSSSLPQLPLLRPSANLKYFLEEGSITTYMGIENKDASAILLGSQDMRVRNKFQVKIIQSSQLFLSIGITDIQYSKYTDCWDHQNFIMMRSIKGEVYVGKNQKMRETLEKFGVGDRISVQINWSEFAIQWFINGRLVTVYKCNKLYQNVRWVPMVRFFNRFDSVQWLS